MIRIHLDLVGFLAVVGSSFGTGYVTSWVRRRTGSRRP